MKFVRLILWPGGAYTDAAHANKAKIMIPYSDEIMNHDYIGSLGCIPKEPKSPVVKKIQRLTRNVRVVWFGLVSCISSSVATEWIEVTCRQIGFENQE